MTSAEGGVKQRGKGNIRDNNTSEIDSARYLLDPIQNTRLYIVPHLFLFSCSKEDNNYRVVWSAVSLPYHCQGRSHQPVWVGNSGSLCCGVSFILDWTS